MLRQIYKVPKAFYTTKTTFNIILASNLTTKQKELILLDIQSNDSLKEKIDALLQSNESHKEKVELLLQSKDALKEKVELLLQSKDALLQSKDERIMELLLQKDQETLHKLQYQQLLTIRGLIELYEKKFGSSIVKSNISRKDKWKKYLHDKKEMFEPFRVAGFTIDQVANHVDNIFKSHSSDIHSIKLVEGFAMRAKGNLSEGEVKVVKVIVEASGWKDIISIE
jgi:exonuclease I